MENIRFETGLKEFNLNGACTVTFCPTDMNFVEKVFSALDALDRKQEEFQDRMNSVPETNKSGIFDLAREIDAEIRGEINSIFGMDVCTPVFGDLSAFAVADGLPVWANLIFAVIDTLDGEFAAEKKKTNPRIQKYTQKYTSKYKR